MIFDSNYEDVAKKVQNELIQAAKSNVRPNSTVIRSYIYDALVQRRPKEQANALYEELYAWKEQEYRQTLASLQFTQFSDPQDNPGWQAFGFGAKDVKPRTILSYLQRAVKVTYKQYFTWGTKARTVDESWNEIKLFLLILPRIHERLYPLNQQHKDNIQLKVPSTLRSFFNHSDSLVIHYRTQSLGAPIRVIVTEEFARASLTLKDREGRSDEGFDLKYVEEDFKRSHSQLVAKVVGLTIEEHQPYFRQIDIPTFARWLKIKIEDVNRYDLQTLAKANDVWQ